MNPLLYTPSTPTSFFVKEGNSLVLSNSEDDASEWKRDVRKDERKNKRTNSSFTRDIRSRIKPDEDQSISQMKSGRRSVFGARKRRLLNKKQTGYSLVNIIEPEAHAAEHRDMRMKRLLQRIEISLGDILTKKESDTMYEEIHDKVKKNETNLYRRINANLSDIQKKNLATNITHFNKKIGDDEEESEDLTSGEETEVMEFEGGSTTKERKDEIKSLIILPELATKTRRENVPRQDGRMGPVKDDRWSSEYMDNVMSVMKLYYKQPVVKYLRDISSRTKLPVRELVDNENLIHTQREIDSEERTQRNEYTNLMRRYEVILDKIQDLTTREIEMETFIKTFRKLGTTEENLPWILKQFSSLNSIAPNVLLTLIQIRNAGEAFYNLFSNFFDFTQKHTKASGIHDTSKITLSLESVINKFVFAIDMLSMFHAKEEASAEDSPAIFKGTASLRDRTTINSLIVLQGESDENTLKFVNENYSLFLNGLFSLKSSFGYLVETERLDELEELISDYSKYIGPAYEAMISEREDKSDIEMFKNVIKTIICASFVFFLTSSDDILDVIKNPIDYQTFSNAVENFIENSINASNHYRADFPTLFESVFGLRDLDTSKIGRSVVPLKALLDSTEAAGMFMPLLSEEYTDKSAPYEYLVKILIDQMVRYVDPQGFTLFAKETRKELSLLEESRANLGKLAYYTQLKQIMVDVKQRVSSKEKLILSESEAKTLEKNRREIEIEREQLERLVSNVIEKVSELKPVYHHTGEYASLPENSGFVILSPALKGASDAAMTELKEHMPDVAIAGFDNIIDYTPVRSHFSDIVAAFMMKSDIDFDRSWQQSNKPKRANLLMAQGILGLKKYRYNKYQKKWTYNPNNGNASLMRAFPAGGKYGYKNVKRFGGLYMGDTGNFPRRDT